MSEAKNLGDMIEAVIVYDKSAKPYESKKMRKELGLGEFSPRNADTNSSAKGQSEELAIAIIEGDSREITRKRLSKILKSGDPITEARTTMVVLARRELSKLLTLIEALDKLENVLIQRVTDGMYDQSPDYELGTLIKLLEGSMSRGLTIIEKVINNPEYEEFLLAYRDTDRADGELSTATKVAQDPESRKKLRDIMMLIKNDLEKTKEVK